MDDDSTDTDDTADSQRSCIAHKHLSREGVVPQETYHRTHEGTKEHHQLFALWNIHNIEIRRKTDMCRNIGQYTQRRTDNSGIACAHTIHTIVQISTIADSCYHEDGHQHKDHPARSHFIFS